MIKSYLRIAFRNLAKNKVHSLINIIGLSTGIAVSIMIGLWIWDEVSFDRYHQNYDRIAQVMENHTNDGAISTGMGTDIPLAAELRRTYGSDLKYVVLSSWGMNTLVASGDKKFIRQGNYIESQAPDMLNLHMLEGTGSGLKDPTSVLISHSLAQSLFENADPLGKLVKLDDALTLKVTGVYEDLPQNSTFHEVSFLAPFWDLTSWTVGHENDWSSGSFQIFVQIADHSDMNAVSAKIKNAKINKIAAAAAKSKPEIFLHPMSKWHLFSEFKNGVNVGGSIQYVWMFGIIGAFILLLACINFMNLSTARSEKRAKEVGIRKAIGSLRGQLITQFFSESLIMSCMALVLALLLAQLILPFFNDVSGKQISLPWKNVFFWIAGGGLALFTGLIAGSYPALYLSSFRPVKVLKGRFKAGPLAAVPRKVMMVIQFTVSVILIVGSLIVFRQIRFTKDRPVGYSRDGLINMIMQATNFHDHFAALRTDLIKSGAVTEVAESQSPAYEADNYGEGFSWSGKDPNIQERFKTDGVTPEYGKALGWQFTKGTDFSDRFPPDSAGMVLNEAAVRYMGLKDPIGQNIKWWGKSYHVIGVIKDVVMESPYDPVNPSVFYINSGIGGILNIRLNPAMPTADALQKIAAICKQYSPSEAIEFKFADEEYARKFATEEQVGKLAGFFAFLAIFISCLGLFGMVSFMAEQRTKEIGVRKVLGASVLNLWGLLSKEFFALVVISILIATPIAYYSMYRWLQHYQYRTEMSWWVFAETTLGLLTITLLTVSFQGIKAAKANPVKSLRTE